MAEEALSKPIEAPPKSIFSTLIAANHILHYHDVVDAYGHISVRNPANPSTFFISGSLAPALVSGLSDLVEYNIEDASPVREDAPLGYVERFIHSEIYKKYSDVKAVVHAHAEAVIPFSITSQPIRPVYHMGGVIGSPVPVFDIARHYDSTDARHDLLVKNQHLGAGLAAAFKPTGLISTIKNYLGTPEPATTYPPITTALMRGHGFTCVGASIEEVVYRSVYLCANARIQTTSLLLQNAFNATKSAERGSAGRRKGEGESSARAGVVEDVVYLSDRETKDAGEGLLGSAARPWKLWCAEVEKSGLYKNTLGAPPGS